MSTANLSHAVWLSKYCLQAEGGAAESHIGATWQRVAKAVAAVEKRPADWAHRFEALLADFRFLPGGRILAGAGSGRQVTLLNCFVAGRLEDSLDGILRRLHETGLTMQQGDPVPTTEPARVGTIFSQSVDPGVFQDREEPVVVRVYVAA